jgi:hypothetical protein
MRDKMRTERPDPPLDPASLAVEFVSLSTHSDMRRRRGKAYRSGNEWSATVDSPLLRRWQAYNERLFGVIRRMLIDQLQLRPGPDQWPIWAMVGLTAGVRVWHRLPTLSRIWRGRVLPSSGHCEAMSLRSRVCLSVRRSTGFWRWTAVWITLVVGACSPLVDASATSTQPARGLTTSSSGVCQAIVALPDVSAAKRAFANLAHEALHSLAADPRLDRAMSARVLESMQRVEADFDQSSDAAALTGDLAALHAVADSALRAIGEDVPACAG